LAAIIMHWKGDDARHGRAAMRPWNAPLGTIHRKLHGVIFAFQQFAMPKGLPLRTENVVAAHFRCQSSVVT
jgi:hypothetical protein